MILLAALQKPKMRDGEGISPTFLTYRVSFLSRRRKVGQRPLRSELAELPTEEELMGATEKLNNGKAGGESGVLPEMVKIACIGDEFPKRLLELVHDVWKEKSVPTE